MDKPVLDDDHQLYLAEFHALSASRTSNGFGANPIQYTEMLAYLALGLSLIPDTPAEFCEAIRLIDNAYLSMKADKDKESRELNSSSSTPRPVKPPRR